MRKATLVLALGILAGTAFAVGQTGTATDAGYVLANPLPVHSKLVPTIPIDGGPPGCDEIQYDDGRAHDSAYFPDKRVRYAVRMDPAYHPAIVAQCDICVWPDSHRDSIYVEIWFDDDGDGMPDFPAVWGAWAQRRQGAPDTAAITVPVLVGPIVCDSGSFWVSMMMDTVHPGVGYEKVASDSVMDFPDHQVYYWPEQDTWKHMDAGGDWMIRSWTMASLPSDLAINILEPSGEIRVGDSFCPRVTIMNLSVSRTFDGWVWLRIQHTCSTDRYLDSLWVELGPLEMKETLYRRWAARYPGLYRMQCSSDTTDTIWRYFNAVESSGVDEYSPQSNLEEDGIEPGPNPVRSGAAIRYRVTGESRVKLRILDTRGRVVRTLVSGCTAAGEHSVIWDACDDLGHPAARGIYFVRLESQDCRETRKVVLTR